MSYYWISVVITILVTALTAFYLLYRSKELNLGILFSITAGSIVLGFSFNPAFTFMLKALSESININKKIALILSLIVVLFIFLLFICIISMIISIAIPKKFSSIDCGIYIDRFFSNIKNMKVGFFNKPAAECGNSSIIMQENVKDEYNLENKLKKPVDTKQIIDTMGIENSENGSFLLENSGNCNNLVDEVVETAEAVTAVAEPDKANAAGAVEEIGSFEDCSTVSEEADVTDTDIAQTAVLEQALPEPVMPVWAASESAMEETGDTGPQITEQVENETTITPDIANHEEIVEEIREIEYIIEEVQSNQVEINARSLVDKAFESKGRGRKEQAAEYYLQALSHQPDREMIFWIVLDVCALYKQLGLTELAKSILEGTVERYGSVIKPDIKEEIIKNLK